MTTREQIEKLAIEKNEKKLIINRVPVETKKLFISIANDEFVGDYGLLLKYILEQSLEYHQLKSVFLNNIDMKLDNIINKLDLEKNEEISEKVLTFSGRRIENKGGDNK